MRQKRDSPFVAYDVKAADDNAILACCEAFTTEDTEFVSAYEVLHSTKGRANRSAYEQYVEACEEHGIESGIMQNFMDYLILSDFAISNTDEHLQNFGVLRDTSSMKLIGLAPIFDSGNSMFFDSTRTEPMDRKALLTQKNNSFHQQKEKMLKHVNDRFVLDSACLPSADEVQLFYAEHGIPDKRAESIAGENKIRLLKDFQDGKSISIYREKMKENFDDK